MAQETYSYSKLDTFNQCGFKYKLIYIDGHKVFSQSIATEFGSLVHKTEENIAKLITQNQFIDYVNLKNSFILDMMALQQKYKVEFFEKDKNGLSYQDKMYSYLDTGIYRLELYLKQHPSYSILGTEIEFTQPYKEYQLRGFIDRVFYDTLNNTYIIQDIKTYSAPIEKKKLGTPLQFLFYALAIKHLYNCTDDQILCEYDLPLCNLIQTAGTPGFITRGLIDLDQILFQINNHQFIPKPTPLCHWCEFCPTNIHQPIEGKNLCPYYSLWTRENKIHVPLFKWLGEEHHQEIMIKYLNMKGVNMNGTSNQTY